MKNGISRKLKLFIFAILVALSLIFITYLFVNEKEGLHSDEIWSYGLSNGYYMPHIFSSADHSESLHNNEWVTGDDFKEYITVQRGERFSYDSVIYNLKNDNHPPLFFMALHTISSLFPDRFSWWFAYTINFVLMIILASYFIRLLNMLCDNMFLSVGIYALYMFSLAGQGTFLFLRQYSMLTTITVATAYYMVVLISEPGKNRIKNEIKLFVCLSLGLLTHFSFLVVATISVLMLLIMCIAKKEYKNMRQIIYMLTIPAFSLALFTDTFSKIWTAVLNFFDSSKPQVYANGVDRDFWGGFYKNIKFIVFDFFGYEINGDTYYYLWLVGSFVVFAIVIASPVIVLCFKYKRHIFVQKCKNVVERIKNIRFGSTQLIYLFFFCSFLGALAFSAWFGLLKSMGPCGDRYIFYVYPFVAIFIGCMIYKLTQLVVYLSTLVFFTVTKKIIVDKLRQHMLIAIFMIVMLSLLILENSMVESPYLFKRNNNGICFEKIAKDKDFALLISEHWLMTCYTDLLKDANRIFIGASDDIEKMSETAKYDLSECDYLVFDVSRIALHNLLVNELNEPDREKIEDKCNPILQKAFGEKKLKFLTEDTIFSRTIYIYEIVSCEE